MQIYGSWCQHFGSCQRADIGVVTMRTRQPPRPETRAETNEAYVGSWGTNPFPAAVRYHFSALQSSRSDPPYGAANGSKRTGKQSGESPDR